MTLDACTNLCKYSHMSEHLAETTIPRWDLADRLRKALREADMSVQDMADFLEISRNTVGSWINGHHRPRPSDLKQWALRTGVSYHWLLHGDGVAPAIGIEPIPAGFSFPALGDRHLTISEEQAVQEDFRNLIRRGTFDPSAITGSAVLPIAAAR